MPRVANDLDAFEEIATSSVAILLDLRARYPQREGDRVSDLIDEGLASTTYHRRAIRELRQDRQQFAARTLSAEPTLATVRPSRRASRELAGVSA